MSNANGFVIENGVLKSYRGPGGDIIIPDGVTEIDSRVFSNRSGLTCVTLPKGLVSIGEFAFANCTGIKKMIIPEGALSIGKRAFIFCTSLKELSLPESLTELGEGAFMECNALIDVILPCRMIRSLKRLPIEFVKAVRKISDEDLAWILLAQTAKAWRTEALQAAENKDKARIFASILTILGKQKKISSAIADGSMEVCLCFKDTIPQNLIYDYVSILEEKKCIKQLDAIQTHPMLRDYLTLDEGEETKFTSVESVVINELGKARLELTSPLDGLKEKMGISQNEIPTLLDREQKKCAPFVLAWLLTGQRSGEYVIELTPSETDVITQIDANSLQNALVQIAAIASKFDGKSKKTNLLFPVSRYASEKTMATLTSKAYRWGKYSKEVFQYACCYSNTRAAMLFAERSNMLDKYATMRGTDADTLRDTVLADFGLAEDGSKVYDLGANSVTVKLEDDLKLNLFDTRTGKSIKSVPKKNVEPDKYEKVKAELAVMKKNIRNAARRRCDRLFEDFLSGRLYTAENWQAVFMKNPVLNRVAHMLIWEQKGITFTVNGADLIDVQGNLYTLAEDDVRVAHPMEMTKTEIWEWRKRFASEGRKQPFLQIWEPVINPNTIKPDRYKGMQTSVYFFVGKEKHGINSFGLRDYSYNFGFSLDGCSLEYTPSVEQFRYGVTDDAYYTLGNFRYERYTRRVNHIVALLDKRAIEGRIKKDDLTIVELLFGFTLAQITEFITVAQEANANNVLAALLDYKNTHFADFDPMTEFTLDW